MFWEDLRKLLAGPALYRLDGLIGTKLVPALYALGLTAIGLWAVDHLFASFSFNFGQGLWGILEILVYGPLWVLALRIICELILVYFKANQATAVAVDHSRGRNTLLEDVRDAIHDLADDDDDGITPATDPAPYIARPSSPASPVNRTIDIDPLIKGTLPRRTARRTPPEKT
jgi:hypothetical protein